MSVESINRAAEFDSSASKGGQRPDPSRMAFFRFEDATSVYDSDMVTGLSGPGAEAYQESLEAGGAAGALSRILFRHAGKEGMSILHVYQKPGLRIPRHTHDADCLYYVVYGEVWVGKRVLRQGDGVYAPANTTYSVETKSEFGAEYLEIRNGTEFDMQVKADKEENWQQLIEDSAARKDEWAKITTYPSRQHVVVSDPKA